MDFECKDVSVWKEALSTYSSQIQSLSLSKNKPNLVSLNQFYCNELPSLLHQRNPNPFITTQELSKLMQWKLSRGKWRPRLLDFVSSIDENVVKRASEKAFESLPDISKAITELSALKGVGPATASAVLAAFAPNLTPFMSDEAMQAALGNSKDYTLKQYLIFANKLQEKAKELSSEEALFTPSDIERALWSSAIGKSSASQPNKDPKTNPSKSSKRKRKT
ncbi:DNA binding protein [Trifolium repens]|nr:DNA binding protein [Trifolium repens]